MPAYAAGPPRVAALLVSYRDPAEIPAARAKSETADGARARRLRELSRQPVVLEVRDVHKTFHIPTHRVDTLKERVVRPFRNEDGRELRALRGVSFEVRRGEFFGIVGRNGSGKSTLLKILASIYRADAGRVRVAGRLAPFIELGVGFNPEFTARENVALNGVMMGLSRRESSARLDRVLDFAGLTEFVDLRLKNYSSGMMVRLAFAVMVEADADIMLVDEVIAVGDASFAQKCMDVFRERRRSGKTVVLVTHDMGTVQHFCDRALLIHDGDMRYLGDPEEAALAYFRLNFAGHETGGPPSQAVPDINIRVLDVWLEDPRGERIENVEQDIPIRFNLLVEARQRLEAPAFSFHLLNEEGVWVFNFGKTLKIEANGSETIEAGRRIRISAELENPLLPGAYSIDCWMSRTREVGNVGLHVLRLLDFHVFGTNPGPGSVYADTEVDIVVEPADARA
jgi:ABC-type polysaccharide/polyol phosphate transport system ATPase subunit